MSTLSFDEEQVHTSTSASRPSGLLALLMRWGLAKDERQAGVVLVVLALGMLGLAGFILVSAQPSPESLTPAETLEDSKGQDTFHAPYP